MELHWEYLLLNYIFKKTTHIGVLNSQITSFRSLDRLESAVCDVWREPDRGVRTLIKWFLERVRCVPAVPRSPKMVLLEDAIDMFHYFKIVDNYYYILVQVSYA